VSSHDDLPPPNPAPPPTAPEPKAAANRRWWIVAGAVVIAAIVVVIIILVATGGDDGSGHVATGPAVAALQKDLTTLGHYNGPINGEYDAATQEAVKKLQTANALPADGRLTPQTIAAIQKSLGGQESQTIKAFQTTLSELGWYTGPIDGAYGPVTAQAVAGLQVQLGVTPDGILGPETFAAFQSQCQPNPSPCKRPATPATTVSATTGGTQAPTVAPTSPSPTTATSSTTTAAGSTTTSQATSTTTTALTTTSTG
jgi:peptidoglycan hydrolase-like protein with peptidoglycan-binding domain